MITGIYAITNTVEDKIYIGQAVDIKRRWLQHRTELRGGTHHNCRLQEHWNEFGEDSFTFKVLVECERHELGKLEDKYIDDCGFYNEESRDLSEGGMNVSISHHLLDDEAFTHQEIPNHEDQAAFAKGAEGALRDLELGIEWSEDEEDEFLDNIQNLELDELVSIDRNKTPHWLLSDLDAEIEDRRTSAGGAA